MSLALGCRSRQLDSIHSRRSAAAADESVDDSTSAAPLFSPVQSFRPRAVSFFSPPKEGDGLSTVMFREDSPSTVRSRARSLHSVTTAPHEVFFSPVSHVSSIRSLSPDAVASTSRSIGSSHHQRGKKSGFERFSQAHISKCRSPRELQQTIADLQAQGNYPLLVRAAQKRLYQVQQSSACPLIVEEQDDGIDVMEARISPKSAATSLVYSYDEERDATDSSLAAPSPIKNVTPSPRAVDSKREAELQQTIEQLNQKIVELDQMLRQEKLDHECNLRQIQQAKQTSVQHAKTLQQSLAASHQTAENMAQQLQELQDTNRTISKQLEAERKAHIAHQQKASQLETSLRRKTQELLQQITHLQESGGKTEELNQLLKSARHNFENIKKERNGIIETILKATGQNTSRAVKMTQKDRESVVRTFVTQAAVRSEKSRSAIQAMQEALNVSEAKCKKVSESYHTTHARLQRVLADQQRLESENRSLTNQVRVLTEELQQSRQETDTLLAKAREENQKEWLRKETMFKNTIRMLQKQLRAEKNKQNASTDTVAKADNNSRALQPVPASVRVGNTVIRPVLNSKSAPRRAQQPAKQSTVSQQLTNKQTTSCSSKVPPPPPQMSQHVENKENAGKVAPLPAPPAKGILKPKRVLGNNSAQVNSQKPKVKAVVRKPQKNESSPLSTDVRESSLRPADTSNSKTPSKSRAEFVRANGGLRALNAKLRQVRSPAPK